MDWGHVIQWIACGIAGFLVGTWQVEHKSDRQDDDEEPWFPW